MNLHFFQQMEILVTLSSGLEFVTFELEIVSTGAIDLLNTLRLRQNGRHFADAIFKCIFLNENV